MSSQHKVPEPHTHPDPGPVARPGMDEIGRRVLRITEQDKIGPKTSLDDVKVSVKTRLKHTHTDVLYILYICFVYV